MNKKFLGLGLTAALLLIGAGCRPGGAPTEKVPDAAKPYNTAPITAETKPPATPATIAPVKKGTTTEVTAPAAAPNQSAAATLPYSQAVATYGQGARFQFVNCHAVPGSLTMKKGDKLMLDNRDATKHRVTVGAKAYTLGAYSYLVVTADPTGQHAITCDGGGVGVVNVQP
ncbi:MAG: hypothetical protein HY983_03680 [Candidatus Magasanikbacteria bacterium]|nr:hypothetical protein [Candidatus Magasanikbacteria bacterium]